MLDHRYTTKLEGTCVKCRADTAELRNGTERLAWCANGHILKEPQPTPQPEPEPQPKLQPMPEPPDDAA